MTGSEPNDPSEIPLSEAAPAGGEPQSVSTEDTSLAEQLEAARKTAADSDDRYRRAVADLENFRKRTVREKDELRLFAASRLLEDLLPVLDNLSLAIAAARQPNADLKGLTGGVELVQQQLKSVLSSGGLKEVSPLGLPFDPHQHESISHQASAEVPAEHVLAVVRPGYVLNGRLLRPASVVVSSGPAS